MLVFVPDSSIYDMAVEVLLKRQAFFIVGIIPFVILPSIQLGIYLQKNYIIRLCKAGAAIAYFARKLLFQYIVYDGVIIGVLGSAFTVSANTGITLTECVRVAQMLIFMNVIMIGIFNCIFFIYAILGRNKRVLVTAVIMAIIYGTAVFDRYLNSPGWVNIYQLQDYLTQIEEYVLLIGKLMIADISEMCIMWGILWTRDI